MREGDEMIDYLPTKCQALHTELQFFFDFSEISIIHKYWGGRYKFCIEFRSDHIDKQIETRYRE